MRPNSLSATDCEILYLDDDLAAINKPAGLLSIQDGYHPELPHVRQLLEPAFGRLWIVHRLDKGTSGALLLARNLAVHKLLNTQFEARQVKKTYHAFISGNPHWEELEVDLPLRVNGDRHHRTVVAPLTGKPALTKVRVLERFSEHCLIEASPHTGYTHQIRAHLAAIGFPIAADLLYQPPLTAPAPRIISRVALHSYQIKFLLPSTQVHQTITAPYPEDFAQALVTVRHLPGFS